MKSLFLYFITALTLFSACKKEQFDAPPVDNGNSDIKATTYIAELKALYNGTPVRIEEDLIIEGVVIADDKSGNFYKSLVIQDQTAGILILLDGIGLNALYPIGRKVFIKCKDLYLGEYNGLIQLGGGENAGSLTRLPEPLIPLHLIRGPLNQTITPTRLAITDLNPAYQNMLVELVNVEFESPGQTYANAANLLSKNLFIQDCSTNKLIVRSSGYASFAGQNVAEGKGSIVGVFSVFRSDFQLLIRDTTDVNMREVRCNGGSSGGATTSVLDVRKLYQGTTIASLSGPLKIKAVVISDRSAGNETGRNIVVQDETAGIVIRFAANHSFNLNTELEIELQGSELSLFNGLLQVNNVPLTAAKILGTKNPIPLSVDVSSLLENIADLESRLVRISGATLSGGTTFSGSRLLNDGTGTATLFTSSAASFKDSPLPTGPKQITALVSVFNTPQLKIRNLNDIQ